MAKSCRVHHSRLGRVTVLELTRSGAAHAHSRPHLLIKLAGADGCFEVGGRPYSLTDAQAILVNSWEPHAYRHADGDRATVVLAIYVDELAGVGHQPASRSLRFAANCMAITDRVRIPVEAIARELDRFSRCDAAAVEDALRALLGQAPAEWDDPRSRGARPARARSEPGLDRRVARCMQYMREHLDARADLRVLGARFGLSRPHLFHLFRQFAQITPVMYWNTLRMEFAVNRLARRETSVSRLAQDLGFTDQSNFARFFRAIQGVAPRDYHAAALGTAPAREPAAG